MIYITFIYIIIIIIKTQKFEFLVKVLATPIGCTCLLLLSYLFDLFCYSE